MQDEKNEMLHTNTWLNYVSTRCPQNSVTICFHINFGTVRYLFKYFYADNIDIFITVLQYEVMHCI